MLKAGDIARREDHRVRGVKSGRTRADRGISHANMVMTGVARRGSFHRAY